MLFSQGMKWVDYPFQVISNAAATVFGGVLTLCAGLSVGSMLAWWVVDAGDLRDAAWWAVPLCSLGSVSLMCIHVWGIFYVAVLMVILHRTLFGEASRLAVFLLLVVLQTCAMGLLGLSMEGFDILDDADSRARALGVLCVFVAAGMGWWFVRRQRRSRMQNG